MTAVIAASPTHQIGDDAEELVQEEEEGELNRRVTELVKMQEDEEPKRTVSQRERPIRGGQDRVVADANQFRR